MVIINCAPIIDPANNINSLKPVPLEKHSTKFTIFIIKEGYTQLWIHNKNHQSI